MPQLLSRCTPRDSTTLQFQSANNLNKSSDYTIYTCVYIESNCEGREYIPWHTQCMSYILQQELVDAFKAVKYNSNFIANMHVPAAANTGDHYLSQYHTDTYPSPMGI